MKQKNKSTNNQTTFKNVALLTNYKKNKATETHALILKWLEAKSVNVSELVFGEVQNIPYDIDLVIAIGGDGTMLHAARLTAPANTPLVGVNRGYLGFLADIKPDTFSDDLESIFSGQGIPEKRILLTARLFKGDELIAEAEALNDVVVKNDNAGRMMHFDTKVNKEYLTAHFGDGLIIATPTGSTAYALSCGGPILSPETAVISLTPICPHTLTDRPIVLNSTSVIELELNPRTASAIISLDGQEFGSLEQGMRLVVTEAKDKLSLIHPVDYDYYKILRSKLHWGKEQSR